MATLTLPGLIDLHVHLRDPEQTHKEDFYTGTKSALAGGYTTIFDMPNNKTPITTPERLEAKIASAKEKVACDIGFYFGSQGDNLDEFKKVANQVFGLKLYLNETTGNFLVGENSLSRIFSAWAQSLPNPKPVLVHAEDDCVESVLKATKDTKVNIHFCHISTANDLHQIIKAKEKGIPVTCGVTPHHLFLTEDDVKTLGSRGRMKPPLKSKNNVEFLWKNLNTIDAIESDHAPHTTEEKESDKPPFGVPGLETTLPLLLTAVSENKLTMEDIIRLCYEGPKKILNLQTEEDTKIEIDPDKSYVIENKNLQTKCGWSPFNGWKVKGKVEKVFIRGTKVFEDGKILAQPGSGKILTPTK